jgi:hypothetical protein
MKFRVTISKADEQIHQSTHEVSKENGIQGALREALRQAHQKHLGELLPDLSVNIAPVD